MKQQIKKSWRKAAGDGPGITPTVAASVTFVLFNARIGYLRDTDNLMKQRDSI